MKFDHINNVDVLATFSKDLKYRYKLIITKKDFSGGKTVCVIMQNPSIANEEVADKSVQFLEKLIFEKSLSIFNNINSLIIVNQFALIQTNGFIETLESIGKNNDAYIKEAIKESDIILIAWGSTNEHYNRQKAIVKMISDEKKLIVYQTRKHPSRGRYKDFIVKISLE